MNDFHEHDVFIRGLCTLVQRNAPSMSGFDIAQSMGWPFVMVAAEEWLDVYTLVLHPAMRATQMHGLFELRSLLLSPLANQGLRTIYIWMSEHNQLEPGDVLPDTLIVGGKLAPITFIDGFDEKQVCFRSLHDDTLCLDWIHTSNGSGLEVIGVLVSDHVATPPSILKQIAHAHHLLSAIAPVSFLTPRHPIREWQTWHVGTDSLEIVAICADTAAPLSLTADAVARIVAVYLSRWRMAARMIAGWVEAYPKLSAAGTHIDNACFFMEIVQQHYPTHTPRRALSVAEGAVVAMAFRDARREWCAIVELMRAVLQSQQ